MVQARVGGNMPRNLIKGRWGLSKDEIDVVRIDASSGSLLEINNEHGKVHAGEHYNVQYSVASLGVATTPNDMMTLTWTTPDTAKWLHMIVAAVSSSGARFRLIEGGSGGGTGPTGIITAYNSNRNSDNTSGIINAESTPAAGSVSYDATLVTGGKSLVDVFIGADGQGNTFVAGSDRGMQEWMLKQGTQYQVSILETDNVPGTLQLSWYDNTNRH